jgi:hypothetical protein
MTWSRWFRRGGQVAARKPQAPPQASRSPPPLVTEDVWLEAEQLAAVWSSESGRLVASVPRPIAKGSPVAVRVSGPGSVMGPLSGVVVSAAPLASGCRLEIDLQADQRGAVGRILGYLRTGKDAPRARAARHPLALPVFVETGGNSTYMNTFSVSRGGCGLVWLGEPPRIGDALNLRLGSGQSSAAFRAMVCWVRESGRERRVGIRFVSGQDGPLAALMDAKLAAVKAPGTDRGQRPG